MTDQTPAYRLCVCGHVRSHHGKQELAQLPYDPRCQWRGCGCPHFLDSADEPAGQSRCAVSWQVTSAWSTGTVYCSKPPGHEDIHEGTFDGDIWRKSNDASAPHGESS